MKTLKSKIQIKKFYIKSHSKIFQAISQLENIRSKFLLVVDKKNLFQGVLNDGDIRRGLLKGFSIEDKIYKIFNNKPIILNRVLSQIEIEKIFTDKKINFFPIVKKKRVQMIYVNDDYNKSKLENKLVVMAGGKGTRLGKFTKKIPKPMLKIKNKPILEHLIDRSKRQGVYNYILAVNHLSSVIKKYFKNGKSKNINIDYIEEKKPLGTAGSLYYLRKEKKDFIVTNADLFTNIDYLDLLSFHKKKKSDFTVVIKKLKWSFPYGAIKYKNFRLVQLNEKPMFKSDVIAGVYAVNPKILKILKSAEHLNVTDFINRILKLKKKVFIYPIYEDWIDIGSYNEYLKIK